MQDRPVSTKLQQIATAGSVCNTALANHSYALQVRAVATRLNADLSQAAAKQTDRPDAEWVAPDCFSRSTTKYWVQPQHRLRIKCEIIKNLPVSIYGGQRRKLAAGEKSCCMCFKVCCFAVHALEPQFICELVTHVLSDVQMTACL